MDQLKEKAFFIQQQLEEKDEIESEEEHEEEEDDHHDHEHSDDVILPPILSKEEIQEELDIMEEEARVIFCDKKLRLPSMVIKQLRFYLKKWINSVNETPFEIMKRLNSQL